MDFLPEYGHLAWKGRFIPMFRLFSSARWQYVRIGKQRMECGTASEAVAAAKERVREIPNPQIRSEQSPEVVPDVFDVDEWQRRRATRQAQEQQEAFGTIFVKHRPVKVQTLKRRARA